MSLSSSTVRIRDEVRATLSNVRARCRYGVSLSASHHAPFNGSYSSPVFCSGILSSCDHGLFFSSLASPSPSRPCTGTSGVETSAGGLSFGPDSRLCGAGWGFFEPPEELLPWTGLGLDSRGSDVSSERPTEAAPSVFTLFDFAGPKKSVSVACFDLRSTIALVGTVTDPERSDSIEFWMEVESLGPHVLPHSRGLGLLRIPKLDSRPLKFHHSPPPIPDLCRDLWLLPILAKLQGPPLRKTSLSRIHITRMFSFRYNSPHLHSRVAPLASTGGYLRQPPSLLRSSSAENRVRVFGTVYGST
mmetsp:Transcript_41029/g.162278  ORF Transcript_41029/g.162278 Transcript_41029/m.162278 type:complete len:302 (+) Transcript_41029:1810-2715(+)